MENKNLNHELFRKMQELGRKTHAMGPRPPKPPRPFGQRHGDLRTPPAFHAQNRWGRPERHPPMREFDDDRPPMEDFPPFEDRPPMEGPHGPMGPDPQHLMRERLLVYILENGKDGIHQIDIANGVHIAPSSLSEGISKLEADGYLKRSIDPNNRRATLIYLTDIGEARACEVQDMMSNEMDKMFERLTEEEKYQLLTLLNKLLGE